MKKGYEKMTIAQADDYAVENWNYKPGELTRLLNRGERVHNALFYGINFGGLQSMFLFVGPKSFAYSNDYNNDGEWTDGCWEENYPEDLEEYDYWHTALNSKNFYVLEKWEEEFYAWAETVYSQLGIESYPNDVDTAFIDAVKNNTRYEDAVCEFKKKVTG